MKKTVLFLILAGITMMPAGAQKKKELTTPVNVNYCLPKVAYDVEVAFECVTEVPGPYQKYAEKELGTKPRITEPGEKWAIRDIRVNPRYMPDGKAVYSVSASGDYSPIQVHLSAEGFLAGVSGGGEGVYNETSRMKYQNPVQDKEPIDIMKFNTYNHLKEVLDTNYTYQQVDGVMKKIWDPLVRYSAKTEQDNVKEAVSEIFRIRSERVKLLGAENNVPDGKSLDIILKEFSRMEENYLSLFLGRQEKRRVVRHFECIPEKAGDPVVVFRFSETDGVTASKNVTAQPYLLRIDNVTVPASAPVAGNSEGAGIFYRVPATGDLKLIRADEELISFPVIVPQLGETKKFPLDVISNEGLSLEFYPQYGALKKINRR